MGWIAINKQGKTLYEDVDGRPMEEGERGNLLVIAQEDYHRRVAIDLVDGVIHIDYEALELDQGTINIKNPKVSLFICDETNIGRDLMHTHSTKPDSEGNFFNTYSSLVWRPIWFTRNTFGAAGTFVVKVIGAQTTLPEEFGSKNIKKMISFFVDGTIGID